MPERVEPFDVRRVTAEEDTVRLEVTGELDLLTEPRLLAAVDEVLASTARRLVLDVTDVEFIDSSGLRALLLSRDRAASAGKSVLLAVVDGPVTRLFDIAGVAGWFDYERAS